ncbi:MAG: response regulator [Elusimicrobia bacterium]|nr:response regulator [Elusimicrobiota bacterium]
METIKTEIENHFGFFPPFFAPALGAPEVLDGLWRLTSSAYCKNPLPALLKEKIAARLSRYCPVPYELVCHACALRSLGMPAGKIFSLMSEAAPASEIHINDSLRALSMESLPLPAWPDPESEIERHVIRCLEFIYLNPSLAGPCWSELNRLLGPARRDGAAMLLSYIRTSHLWTESHPEISCEADRRHQEQGERLAREEPRWPDFVRRYPDIVRLEQRSLEQQLTAEIAQRKRMEEQLTRYTVEVEESRDRLQEQASQLARQAEELYQRREELLKEVSERKRAEESIRIFAEVVKNMPIGVIVWRLEDAKDVKSLRLIATNPAAEVFTGLALEKCVGKTLPGISPVLAGSSAPGVYAEVIRSGAPRDLGENHPAASQSPQRRVSVKAFPLPNQCVGITFEDITEQKQAEEELARARDAALELARTRSEFLANMSHEIRTPLNAIIGMAGLLMESELSRPQREFTETITSAGDTLLGIISDILDFSKIESGKMELETLDFDLRGVFENAVGLLAARAQAKGLQIASVVPAEVPALLRGDPGRLRQILINLLSNAVKFTEKGEVVVRAEKEEETDRHILLKLSVSDTGIGISPDVQRRLFQPFSQADASTTRKYGGTGLGLAISKRLVELMGGEIGVESEPGQWSKFWVRLRFGKQDHAPAAAKARDDLSGLRVLILDANATQREILQQIIASWKMRGDATASETEALSMLRRGAAAKEPYHVVLLDMGLPGMGGLAFALKVKSDAAICSVRTVALTSLAQPMETDVLRAAGIAAALTKPVKQSPLYDCLAHLTDGLREAASAPGAADGAKHDHFRILVVEDNPVNQKVAALQLERLGYRVDIVGSGREAVDAVRDHPYNLILMDCQMPEMDGYETTAAIRRQEGRVQHTPVIAMTAHALEGDRKKCLAAGMDDYISKPVKLKDLAALLSRWDVPIDPSRLENLREAAGDESVRLVGEVIDRFLEDTPGRLENIRKAVQENNSKNLEMAAHSLKGSSANLGAKGLWTLCERIEDLARRGKPAEADRFQEELREEFARVKVKLEKEKGGQSR